MHSVVDGQETDDSGLPLLFMTVGALHAVVLVAETLGCATTTDANVLDWLSDTLQLEYPATMPTDRTVNNAE